LVRTGRSRKGSLSRCRYIPGRGHGIRSQGSDEVHRLAAQL